MGEGGAAGVGVREVECGIPGHGMFWEADECGRCLRDVSGFFFLFFLFSPFLFPFSCSCPPPPPPNKSAGQDIGLDGRC